MLIIHLILVENFYLRDGKYIEAFYDKHNNLLGLPKYHLIQNQNIS